MTRLFRIAALLGVLVFVREATAQVSELRGVVVDDGTGKPLPDVHVEVDGTGMAPTDAQGRFFVPWKGREAFELRLERTGYEALTYRAVRAPMDRELQLRMKQKIGELDPVVIRPGPQVVYERKDLHVGAYRVNADGLWVLVYERPKLWHAEADAGAQVWQGARLHLLDTLFQERLARTLPGPAMALHQDFRQRPIVEGMDVAWMTAVDQEGIDLWTVGKDTLRTIILPWTDSIPGRLLGNDLSPTYPAFAHFAYDPVRKEAITICTVEDEHLVELFRSQYKYMSGRDKVIAMDLGRELGMDCEVVAGYMTSFYNDLYYRVPYAPLFVVHDTLCVFDRYAGSIRRFTRDLRSAGDVPFSGKADRDEWDKLVQDGASGQVHAVFTRGQRTWLRAIDPTTGRFGTARMLTHPFPEDLQVFDGYAYYVYRTYGSLQRRTLYREALR